MNNRAMLEGLEERRFLSVTPVLASAAPHATTSAVHAKVQHSTAVVNLIGKYSGTASLDFFGSSNDVDIALNIKSQQSGKLKGTISLNGSMDLDFKVTGTFNANGHFTLSYKKHGFSATLTGHKTSSGGLAGTMSAGYSVFNADGRFSLTAKT